MPVKRKKDPIAQALGRKRWAKASKRERREVGQMLAEARRRHRKQRGK